VSAALGGHQAVLEYLISVGTSYSFLSMSPNIFLLFSFQGHDLLWSLANPAARRGHLVLLRWLDTKGLRFTNVLFWFLSAEVIVFLSMNDSIYDSKL